MAKGLMETYPQKIHIAIYTHHGSPHWNVIDFATMKAGHVSIPLHGNASYEDISYILEDAHVDLVFIQNAAQKKLLDKIQDPKFKLYALEDVPGVPSYKELFKKLRGDEMFPDIPKDTLATIIYTSGSTGLPKGVMLSHDNIISNIKSVISLIPVNHHHVCASYLPLSHVFERVAVLVYITVGARVYYIDDPKALVSNVQEIRPHYMTSVPRILEKVYDNIHKRVKDSNFITKQVIRWALQSGRRSRRQSVNPLRKLELLFCDLIVFRKWRKLLGGRLKGIIVGAAAMPAHIAQLFSDAGIMIREGYGLTETSPIISFNRFEAGGNRFGTVGIPLPSVDVKIDEPDEEGIGEIVVKGPNVMLGYYHNEELTKEKINEEGWFYTGDVGKIVHKRFLSISDRKKNIFKTSSGRYVAPQYVEALLKHSDYIDQAMVIGFQKPFITALIIPNFPLLESWASENKVHWTGPQYMAIHPKVVKFYQEIIDEINEKLKRHEIIKKFHLLHEEWSIDTGEYTPTLKLKRRNILGKFEKEIGKMYA